MDILHIFLAFIFCHTAFAVNSCRFEHSTNGIIDLSSIGLRNGHARFRNIPTVSSSDFTYSFNPCYSFTETGCKNVAVCQRSQTSTDSYVLAKQNASSWSINSHDIPVLTYSNGIKTVEIMLICSLIGEDRLEITGESRLNYYNMRLYSRCACWNECTFPRSTSTSESSTTTIPVIQFDACAYQDSRYGTINLTSIGSPTGIATFQDVESIYSTDYLWSYNPCYQFSEYNCFNAAACRITKNTNLSFSIGYQQDAYWINMNSSSSSNPSIIYPTTSSDMFLTVELICNRSMSYHQLYVRGEIFHGKYQMQLQGPCACWNGCINPDPSSINWQFLILASSIAALVFILFCLFISCLFCSKPKRNHPILIINEKTPFFKSSINSHV